jgi:EAL domain-containing protein (putative c-di-GMP-specific phosphodiesterase class I)
MLILDDDDDVGQTLKWIAEALDFSAEFVSNGDDFFKRLEEISPDVVSIDLVMPGMDGVEIMRLLAERRCKAKIIVSSGMGTRVLDAARRSAMEHGLDILGVLSKPISEKALRQLVGDCFADEAKDLADPRPQFCEDTEFNREDLELALERDEFFVMYQPKISCRGTALAGFEALVRWSHPEKGLVMPGSFIPVVELAGLIDALTEQVLEKSLNWFSAAFPEGNLELALNISARSLVDLRLVDKLAEICARRHVAAGRIILELTETSAMVDPMLSLDVMTRFRVKGFQLSIDDFGTAYSSMVQLVRLPYSEIKVDRSFVMHAHESQESRTVIKSIIDLGHSLGMTVTAEGVEDLETFDFVSRLGCDLAQGYAIARPMTGAAAEEWARQRVASFGAIHPNGGVN